MPPLTITFLATFYTVAAFAATFPIPAPRPPATRPQTVAVPTPSPIGLSSIMFVVALPTAFPVALVAAAPVT